MTDDSDFPPADIPTPRRKKRSSTQALKRQLEDLQAERAGLIERCQIAERAASANLGYAQAAREAMEDLAAKILTKLDEFKPPVQ